MKDKKAYQTPSLTTWGSVADLTQTGCTNPGQDAMNGSVDSNGKPPVNCGGGPPHGKGRGPLF